MTGDRSPSPTGPPSPPAAPPQPAGRTAPATGLVLRPGRAEEAEALTALGARSLGWWGYDAQALAARAGKITLDAERAALTVVAEVDARPAGFHLVCAVSEVEDTGELALLYVEPEFIGSGLGRVLFEDARRCATARGWHRLLIETDPHARAFYERVGAVQVGERPDPLAPGGVVPQLELALRPGSGRPRPRATYWR